MESFPAIFIGGPPHSGKSVLIYSLTRALRQRGVQHYVIRAAPDGEGDWANEADQASVRTLRVKSDFTPAFTDFICQSLTNRHLPLIVDVGGRPTPYQERIFGCCTHAVLLATDADALAQWRALAARHCVPVLAELTSRLQGNPSITAVQPILQGIITGLERGQTASGSTFDALVDLLANILYVDPDALYRFHERRCPIETVIHLDRLALTLNVAAVGDEIRWEPRHVPRVLDYLPGKVPLALYGRGTNWLYTAVALLAFPAPFAQFDPRLGWACARPLQIGSPGLETPLAFRLDESPDCVHLQVLPRPAPLEYDELDAWRVPSLPAGKGLILSGRIPYWFYTSLAQTYRAAPWIAAYQPQIEGAVVAQSSDPAHPVGERVALDLHTFY